MEAQQGPAGCCVDPVFQHSQYVGLIRDLVKAASVGFGQTAKKAAGHHFCACKRASNRYFLSPPYGPLLTGEEFFHVECQGAPEDAQNWFVGSPDVKNAFHPILRTRFTRCAYLTGCKRFCTARRSRLRSWLFGKTIQPNRTCFRILDLSCSFNTSNGFFVGDFLLSRCHGPLYARGCADSPVLICRDHFTPPLLGGNHVMGSLILRWWAQTAQTFISHVSVQVYRKPVSLGVHDISLPSGSADVVGDEVSPANAYCRANG